MSDQTRKRDTRPASWKRKATTTVRYVCERVDCRVESVAIRTNTRDRFLRTPLCPVCQRPMRVENKPAKPKSE